MQPDERPEAVLLRELRRGWSERPNRKRWLATARPEQITPLGDWFAWLVLAGRGFGKTRTGAEDAAEYGFRNPGHRIALIGPTFADARDVMVEGDSGLRALIEREHIEAWNRSLGELELTNGTRFKLFSAEEPERLRGPQHHRAWADEMAAWKYLQQTWDQLLFGLRLGERPQVVVTTTPKPRPLIRQLRDAPTTHLTTGSTFDNAANLAGSALAQLRARYEGTRLGRQELEAELLEDTPGALWTRAMLEAALVEAAPGNLTRVVVAVDPSGSSGDTGDAQGIVAAGVTADGRAYVLEDATMRGSPDAWAQRVAFLHDKWRADRVVAERNYGGAMVEAVLRTAAPNLPVKLVTASRGKYVRAEPVAALYEQGKVHHVGGMPELEDELTMFTGGGYVGAGSPNRADALVWALTELMLEERAQGWLDYYEQLAAGTLPPPPGAPRAPAHPLATADARANPQAALVRLQAPPGVDSVTLRLTQPSTHDVTYRPSADRIAEVDPAHVAQLRASGWRELEPA